MPSKGVDYQFYVANTNLSIEAAAYDAGAHSPNFAGTFSSQNIFRTGNTQINTDLPFHVDGKFSWSVNAAPAFGREAEINALTGNMSSGNLSDMMETPSVAGNDYAISYGFYDSGPGFGGLTNQDQAYAYVSSSMSDWMASLVAQNPALGSTAFSNFALPGAHDAGTFDLDAVDALLAASGTVAAFLNYLGPLGLLGAAISGLTAAQAKTAIINLAVTQKDTILTQLDLGCRYFDFRPGKLPAPLNTVAPSIYHIHAIVPGCPLKSLLTDVLAWLDKHPGEIVVVSLNTQGFASPVVVPTEAELQDVLAQARVGAGSDVEIGGVADVGKSYTELLASQTRLLFLNQIDGWYEAQKYDSYTDAYATTSPQPILQALEAMKTTAPAGDSYTVLQLQGTATGVSKEVIVSCALSQSSASSPLMSTKAYFDSYTYPWLQQNATQRVPLTLPLVFLNDFVDNILATVASEVTLGRSHEAGSTFTATIESIAFPNTFLRMDGRGVAKQNPAGSGTVNAQYSAGAYERFRVRTGAEGVVTFESVAFPGVYLRMDGQGFLSPNGVGGGVVNCQFNPAGPFERFVIETDANGNCHIRSVAFPECYLRLDASGDHTPEPSGLGVVNCQYDPPGPWERFRIQPV